MMRSMWYRCLCWPLERGMNAAKIFTVAVVCLGLGISGAHGVALCFGSDGSLSLEAALDGACVGAQTSGCGERDSVAGPPGSSLRGVDDGGSCRDVVIGQDGVNAPPPSAASAKRLIERPGSSAGPTPAEISIEDFSPPSRRGEACQAATGQRPPPSRTTVLLL